MKKFFQMVAFASLTVAMSACYNDDELWNKVDELETKVEANASDIATLSALVDALNNGKVIVGTQQTENGYVLTFNDGSQVSARTDNIYAKFNPPIPVIQERFVSNFHLEERKNRNKTLLYYRNWWIKFRINIIRPCRDNIFNNTCFSSDFYVKLDITTNC